MGRSRSPRRLIPKAYLYNQCSSLAPCIHPSAVTMVRQLYDYHHQAPLNCARGVLPISLCAWAPRKSVARGKKRKITIAEARTRWNGGFKPSNRWTRRSFSVYVYVCLFVRAHLNLIYFIDLFTHRYRMRFHATASAWKKGLQSFKAWREREGVGAKMGWFGRSPEDGRHKPPSKSFTLVISASVRNGVRCWGGVAQQNRTNCTVCRRIMNM